MTPGPKVRCIVPHCMRITSAVPGYEWICQRHWVSVPVRYRKVFFRIRRRIQRADEINREILMRHYWLVWDNIKRRAIEAATGIG